MSSKGKQTKSSRRAQLTVQTISLDALNPHPRNPRVHPAPGDPQWAVLKASLAHDYFDPTLGRMAFKDIFRDEIK